MHSKLILCAYMIASAAATEGTVAHAGKVIKTGLGRGEARRIADERNNNAVLYGVCDPSTQRCDVDILEPFQENKNSSNTSGWSIRAHPVSYRCPAKEPSVHHGPLSTAELDALAATDVREAIPRGAPPRAHLAALHPHALAHQLPRRRRRARQRRAPRRFYRSGVMDAAAADPDALAWVAANVRRVFDMRLARERQRAPDPHVPGVDNVWLDGQEGYPDPVLADFAVDGGRPAWRTQYMSVAMSYSPIMRAVLEHVRDRPEEPVLFHCTAGRDRTGVMAGLLHHLAGSPPEVATRDYMLSRVGTEPAREKLLHFAMSTVGVTDPDTPGFVDLISLRPEFWAAFLEGLQDEFGGWDGYVVKGLGLSPEDLAKIKANMRS
ncbi:hypothetical protein ACCO45_005946 [Purpureocillium lilacinum]|uniref:Uncharacterized protein n=1 Tax=Purpureocillium lilacinum TaxID=33203 RepID=A0ACC4DWW0_PURLI